MMQPGLWLGSVGSAWRARTLWRDPGAALREIARGAGDAIGLRLYGRRVLLLLDPGLVGELLVDHQGDTTKGPGVQRTRGLLGDGLLTAEGAAHRKARRLVAPAFAPRRLATYTDIFATHAAAHVTGWTDGATLDMHQQMGALTLDIVGASLLGVDLSQDTTGIRSSLETALASFNAGGSLLGRRRGTGEADAVHRVIERVVEARRASPSDDRGDVISALLAASGDADGLSESEVHDHVLTLLMAGHETTANALSWALHLLGEHPEVEQALHAEVDRLAGAPAFGNLPQLTWTRAVITETMRLYPPAWILGRTVRTDLVLGAWHAPAGTVVAVSPLLLHRDPRWFPDPDRFDPGRWLDERRAGVPRHAYLPFGAGPRSCIGEQFAWAEATTVLATIAARYTARTIADHAATPSYRVTLRPAKGLPMRVRSRTRPVR